MHMIRHENRREHLPIPQSYRRIFERRECCVLRENWLTILNTQSYEIDTLDPSVAKRGSWEGDPCTTL
jgi:hypothetical protein